jgi:hypothetical protein
LESLPQIGSRIPSWPSLVWRDLFLPVIPTGAVTQSVAGEVERSAFSVPVFPSRFSHPGFRWRNTARCCSGSIGVLGEALVSLVSNWNFFQRADNSEGVPTLSRGKNILK